MVEAAPVEGVPVPLLVLVRPDQVVPPHVPPELGAKRKKKLILIEKFAINEASASRE